MRTYQIIAVIFVSRIEATLFKKKEISSLSVKTLKKRTTGPNYMLLSFSLKLLEHTDSCNFNMENTTYIKNIHIQKNKPLFKIKY